MGVTREDLVRSGRWLNASDAEWAAQLKSVEQAVGGYMKNDEWAVKIKKNVGILLTGSTYGRPYLKASLESHQRLGFWTVLSFDNFINPEYKTINYNDWLPPIDVMNLVDTFLLPHHQTWGGVSYPFIWQLRLASGIFSQFEYVMVNNSDCVIEKPEGFPKLLEKLGDADLMSCGPSLEREIGTAGLLMRSSAFIKIAKHMNDHMVPFEEYEKSTQPFGNTEGRLAVAVRELGLKQVVVEPGSCPHHKVCEQLHTPGKGFWYETLGFRHIHGEHNYAHRYKAIPPHFSYLDSRYMGDEYNIIKKYWETVEADPAAAKALLEGWWMKD